MTLHLKKISKMWVLLLLICAPIELSQGQETFLDCGVRPPKPLLDPWNVPKYGAYGWDNPQLARREDFPWQVGIFRKIDGSFRYECGGTLIPGEEENEVLVLTAARCVTESINSTRPETKLENLRVVVSPVSSNYNTNIREVGSQKLGIRRIEINPLYEAKSHDSDAAIVQLDKRVKLGPLALPVCLPPDNNARSGINYGMMGEIAGFGWDTRRNFSENLRYARHPVVLSQTCQDKLAVKVNDYLEFCTAYEKDSTACQADYGGGLVFQYPKIQGRYFLQGLLSNLDATPVTAEGYCENHSVFKRIGPYLQWIQRTQEKLTIEEDVKILAKPRPTPGFPLDYIVPEYAKIARDLHNHYRAIHKVPSMRLVGKIQKEAQRLAEELVQEDEVELPDPDKYPFSVNVYTIPRLVNAQDAVRDATQYWYRGFNFYDRNDPRPSAFTQMVWKSSNQIGVGVATNGRKTTTVVLYWPKGNVLYAGGKDYQRKKSFHDNVRVLTSVK